MRNEEGNEIPRKMSVSVVSWLFKPHLSGKSS